MKKTVFFLVFFAIISLVGAVLYKPSYTANITYDTNMVVVPVSVHLVDDNTSQYTTGRDLDDVKRIFEGVNEIWFQGQIEFYIENVETIKINNNNFSSALGGDLEYLVERDDFDSGMINAYFARYVNANGISFSPQGILIVGDLLTVYDHRTTAHELGHALGLRHAVSIDSLMYNGSDSEILSKEEIEIARRNAIEVYEIDEARIN